MDTLLGSGALSTGAVMVDSSLIPSFIRSAAQVSATLRAIYGEDPAAATGVLHVLAVWRAGDRRQLVLRINEHSPRSELDFFLLNVARARSEAILTTGRILRAEPSVTHVLQGPAGVPAALAEWRRELVGLERPPRLVVLSSSQGLDLSHPALASQVEPWIVTSPEAAAGLEPEAERRGIRVLGLPRLTSRRVVDYLVEEMGCSRVSIEAGPSTALDLYREPVLVDEVLLSVFLEATLAEAACGQAFLSEAELEARFEGQPAVEVAQESGRWAFRRLPRRAR